ncbi:hypothetical protein [Modestobacter sp. SYSU DS0875]
MLIDCDTCTVRGTGCADCVVTMLLGAPPDWQGSDPCVVPLVPRATAGAGPAEVASRGDAPGRARSGRDVARVDATEGDGRAVVELDDVEHRAVRALAEFGLVPPLRHQDASGHGDRNVS